MSPAPREAPTGERDPRRDRDQVAPRALLPSAIVFGAALLVSSGLHLNVYEGLAALGSLLEARRAQAPAEISFVVVDPGDPTEDDEPAPTPEPSPAVETTQTPPPPAPVAREHHRIAPPRERPQPIVAPPEPPPPAPPPEVAVPVPAPATPPAPQPPPPQDDRRSIVQHTDDPAVDNPDARFLADQARVVEEETIASLRNTLRDDADPVAAADEHADPTAETEGNDRESESADLREVEGDDRRRVTEHEASQDPARDRVASTSRRPSDQGSATSESGGHESQAGTPQRGQEAGAQARGGGPPPGHDVLVSDRFGSFVVRVPDGPTGTGPGTRGGARVEGAGQGERGTGRLAGRAGERGGGAEARRGTRGGEQLGLSYADFESVFGEEELRREREARLEERRSRSRGRAREAEWNAFRAAIENYTPEVRPGNQTALNAAASPFATFLSDMHRRIHREFADRYIASLGPGSPEGVNDPTLRTTLEISVNEDGSLHTVGIVRTSGNTLYDFGAFASVWRAQPFPRPPSIILSGDGRAWLRWHFDRNPRHCGTWNAEPYMLANGHGPVDRGEPPEAPAPSPGAGEGFEVGPALPIGDATHG